MENWSKDTVLGWLRDHCGETVTLRMRGGTFFVRGVCLGVDEIQACSADYQESAIAVESADADFSISFHDRNLSAHLLLGPKEGKSPVLSMAASVPYERLVLEAGAGAAESSSEEKKTGNEETPRSPYELLH